MTIGYAGVVAALEGERSIIRIMRHKESLSLQSPF